MELIQLVNPVIIFLSHKTLLRELIFLLRSLALTLSSALYGLCLSSVASICCTVALPALENSDHIIVSVSIDFPLNWKRDTLFMAIIVRLRWCLRSSKDIFKFSAFAVAAQFCELAQVGNDAKISHCKNISGQASLISTALFYCCLFLLSKVAFSLYKCTIWRCLEYCCHVWIGEKNRAIKPAWRN